MYAIVNISGKQFKASEGAELKVPRQKGKVGTNIIFDQVLLFNDGNLTQFGNPNIAGASVTAIITEHGRDKKILVYKKKRRKGYQRKNGHRQQFTKIEFKAIDSAPSKTSKLQNLTATQTNDTLQEEE